jgi:hypothetical protein
MSAEQHDIAACSSIRRTMHRLVSSVRCTAVNLSYQSMPILAKQRWEEFAQGMVAGKSATKAYIDAGFSKHGAAQAAYKLSKPPLRCRSDC